tara:strand:- start:275 stop:817 length:543 start_codon:yes stop_codon:yes gene_type:complete
MAMDTSTTIARPYAKAAFEYALEKSQLQKWSDLLCILASVSLDLNVQELIQRPGVPAQKLALLFIEIAVSRIDEAGKNFVRLLADNKRLLTLADIKTTFDAFKAEQEKSLEVSVVSFIAMTDKQKTSLAASLKKRLNRDITIDETIDETILGGAIIRAGDMVMDGSVKGKLEKLRNEIAA